MEKLKELLWGTPTICVLLGTGIYLMILLKGLPIRKLPAALRLSLGMGREAKDGEEKGISAFSCLATELASTIGTGNILGVVGAMELGGPGALFWMLLSAFTGLPTKLVETALSVKYKSASKEGEAVGGPMVTLAKAFPAKRLGKALGIFYAALAVAGSFCMGNLVQANSIALSLRDAFGIEPKRLGFLLTFLTILAVLGGMKKISKIATFLVPAMGSLYLAGCLGILLCHLENLVPAIAQIIRCAFHPRSALGGLFGTATCS
ncbi:MAG: sodium:alanine symporter family protein, partial [Lachnospiraceae bacterium]|nr:sodium:alanine symporter family protein [Lachnospiraceae bacterium]